MSTSVPVKKFFVVLVRTTCSFCRRTRITLLFYYDRYIIALPLKWRNNINEEEWKCFLWKDSDSEWEIGKLSWTGSFVSFLLLRLILIKTQSNIQNRLFLIGNLGHLWKISSVSRQKIVLQSVHRNIVDFEYFHRLLFHTVMSKIEHTYQFLKLIIFYRAFAL